MEHRGVNIIILNQNLQTHFLPRRCAANEEMIKKQANKRILKWFRRNNKKEILKYKITCAPVSMCEFCYKTFREKRSFVFHIRGCFNNGICISTFSFMYNSSPKFHYIPYFK